MLNEKIVPNLVCPITHEALYYDKETSQLITASKMRCYPVIGGIPYLLPDSAPLVK